MAAINSWENQLYDFVYNSLKPNLLTFSGTALPFNHEQRRAVQFISNPTNNIPQTVRSPIHPRVNVIPTEQINTFRDPGLSIHISHQVVGSTMIIGPPGTGKTHVICAGSILRVLNQRNLNRASPMRLSITTATNAGSYRIYEKFHEIADLANTPDFIERIKLVQAENRLDTFAFRNLQNRLNLNPDDFTIRNNLDDSNLLREFLIFVGTTDSISILLNNRSNPPVRVHGIIYDEASQLTVPQFFQVIPNQPIQSLCLVGDDAQLPPVATLVPLGISALSYLQGLNTYQNTSIPQSRRIELQRQYRMHPAIAQLTQRVVRSTRNVIPDGPTVRQDYLLSPTAFNLSNLPTALSQTTLDILEEILCPEHPLVIVDTSKIPQALDQRIGTSRTNPTEAQIGTCLYIALNLAYDDLAPENIIITSPYRQQINLFQTSPNIRSGTVHQYQGQEARVVIYSLTFANPTTKSSFFTQLELMYVGLSRAQRKLIILGNQNAMVFPDQAIEAVREAIFDFQYNHGGPGYPNYTTNPVSHIEIDNQFLTDINNNLI